MDTLPAVAVRVAVCAEVTAATVAVKLAEAAPAATVTEAGTVTAELLLARLTLIPPVAAAVVSVTVHASVPVPVNVLVEQESPLRVASDPSPVPLRLTLDVPPVAELLVKVICPLAVPAVDGSNATVTLAVCPGVRVAGKLAPESLNPVPLNAAELTMSVSVPVDCRVTDLVTAVFNATAPKLKLVVLNVSAGAAVDVAAKS